MIKSSPWTNVLRPLSAALGVVLVATAVILAYSARTGGANGERLGAVVALAQAARSDARGAIAGDPQAADSIEVALDSISRLGLEAALEADAGAAALIGRQDWGVVVDGLGDIVAQRESLLEARRLRERLGQLVPQLLAATGNLMASLTPDELTANRGHLERFELTLEGMQQDLRALGVAESVAPALDRLEDAGQYLGQVIQGLRGQDVSLGIQPVRTASAAELVSATALFDEARGTLTALTAQGGALRTANAARLQLEAAADRLLTEYRGLAAAPPSAGWLGQLPLVMVGIALLLLALMAFAYNRAKDVRKAAAAHAEQNERNQEAILRLLDELSSLADGDLTVQATVTEDITGAIADSINYAIEALRELVATVNDSSILVDAAAKQSEATARHLVRSSDSQARQVAAASESVARVVQSIEEISGNAERCSDVARHAVDVAHKGGEAVRRTIEGMNTIRETIQDTSKRIKRLGESSQEIGNIVELIEEIAEQTNILALNASIEASRAGDGSRGFAVVADEVQKLAERSSTATRKIEVLVSTIQSDTNEAVVSMERSTTDVVGGALLAENAGAALEEIEQVSHQIASLVQNISGSASEQSGATASLLENMSALQSISSKTTDSTTAASSAISKLSQLASQLRQTVAGFTLPTQPSEATAMLPHSTVAATLPRPPALSAEEEPAQGIEPRRRSG